MLWGIWFVRNKKLWEGKSITPAITVKLSSTQVEDWQSAMHRKELYSAGFSRTEEQDCSRWSRPQEGWVKLNVDASVFNGVDSFAVGMVLRDDKGEFIRGKNLRHAGTVNVMEAEAIGLQEALAWLEDMGVQNVVIECDSQLVTDSVQYNKEYQLEVGNVLEFCRAKLRQRADFILHNIKKQANKVAHYMARIPCLVGCYNIFTSPPQDVLESLYSDISPI